MKCRFYFFFLGTVVQLHEFRENQRSGVPLVARKFVSIRNFKIYLSVCGDLYILDMYVMSLTNLRFVKIGALEVVLYSGRQSNFGPNFCILLPI